MVDNSKEVRKQIFDVIGCIAAVVTVLAYLLLIIDSNWSFIPNPSFVYNVLMVIKTWAPLIVVAITGLEFFSTRSFLSRILFYIALAIIVVFMFFPSTWAQFVALV